MSLILGEDAEVAYVVGTGLGQKIEPPFVGIGIVQHGLIVGGYIINDFNGANVELTAYAPNMLRRGHLVLLARYIYGQLQCRRITARANRKNKASLRTLKKAGFKYEATLKGYYPDGDAVLFGLLRENCRWLR